MGKLDKINNIVQNIILKKMKFSKDELLDLKEKCQQIDNGSIEKYITFLSSLTINKRKLAIIHSEEYLCGVFACALSDSMDKNQIEYGFQFIRQLRNSPKRNFTQAILFGNKNCSLETIINYLNFQSFINNDNILEINMIIKNHANRLPSKTLKHLSLLENVLTYEMDHSKPLLLLPNYDINFIIKNEEDSLAEYAIFNEKNTKTQIKQLSKIGKFFDIENLEKIFDHKNGAIIFNELLNNENVSAICYIISSKKVAKHHIDQILEYMAKSSNENALLNYISKIVSKDSKNDKKILNILKNNKHKYIVRFLHSIISVRKKLTKELYLLCHDHLDESLARSLIYNKNTPIELLWKIESTIKFDTYEMNKLKTHENYKKVANHILNKIKSN